MAVGVVRTSYVTDNAITQDFVSIGGVLTSGETSTAAYSVLMLDGATGKWLDYAVGTYAAGQKLGITKEDVDASVSDAGVSLLVMGCIRRGSVDTTITTALEAALMQSGIFLI